jgi:hypothetical protein
MKSMRHQRYHSGIVKISYVIKGATAEQEYMTVKKSNVYNIARSLFLKTLVGGATAEQ